MTDTADEAASTPRPSLTARLSMALASALPPERAHGLTIRALASGLGPTRPITPSSRLHTRVFGCDFPSPIGLAAGFDKNAEVVDPILGLGAAFVEVGAVTPRPQAGNPKPRVFRLTADAAIINRLGFNNDGMDVAAERLRARRAKPGVVGVNIGANANSVDREADYVMVFRHLFGLADFFTVNVSSPSTAGLRNLQAADALEALLRRLVDERSALVSESGVPPVPLLVKIAPDLDEAGVEAVAAAIRATDIDGAIATNTTLSRPEGLKSPQARQAGGLSGPPIFDLSTAVLRRLYAATGGAVPIIGVGGVDSAEAAYAKIRAGAALVQLYTGLVFKGPDIFAHIAEGLDALLARDGFASVADAVGADAGG